ncbi:hypothetical protein BT69DRAFT_1370298 [Atractiella rhizophila]|nr:hypothetical protein BT69DRAFT_1370298 [Atractiella rhizophila]
MIDDQGTESIALVHLITPVTLEHGTPIHLSILPSFLSQLPPSIHMLRITFLLPLRFWRTILSKLFFFSLEDLENAVEYDDAMHLSMTLGVESIMVAFGDFRHHAYVDLDDLDVKAIACKFHLPDNRSEAIFDLIALYSEIDDCFVPTSEWEGSTIPSTGWGTTIQLSLCSTRTQRTSPCTITQLPTEILSLVFELLSFDRAESLIEGTGYLVSFERLSAVCQLWKAVAVPYLNNIIVSIKEMHARLTAYPNAGHLWRSLWFKEDYDVSVEMAKDVIAGSPNVTVVWIDAFCDEEEAKTVLHAIEGLTRLDDIIFGYEGWRKWKKDEVENFMRRMGDRIRFFSAYNVEDSATSTSPGLQLSSNLKSLLLSTYPPLPSLSLPLTLTDLYLSNLCPLPPSISGSCLPPLLDYLKVTLAPYAPDRKTSVLPNPLDLSHLKHLTELYLDGGEETSNLVSPQFFHSLRNAIAITTIDVRYCVVDWEVTPFVFSDFISWFFGDRWVKEEGDMVDGAEKMKTIRGHWLTVQLFFAAWPEGEICIARSALGDFGVSKEDEYSWVREGGEE